MRDVHKRKATVSSHSLGSSCDGGNSVTVHLVVFRHLKKPFLVHATLSPHSSYSQLICQQSKRDWSIKVIQQAKKNPTNPSTMVLFEFMLKFTHFS